MSNNKAELSHKAELKRRVNRYSKINPYILVIRAKLLAIGGAELVQQPNDGLGYLVRLIAKFGELMEWPVTLREMEASNCHANAAALWLKEKERSKIVGLATGYALSDDGLWRRHSWAMTEKGIIETTVGRIRYFGVILNGEGANLLANAFLN